MFWPTEPDYDAEPIIQSAALQHSQQISDSSSSSTSYPKRLYLFVMFVFISVAETGFQHCSFEWFEW